MPMCPAVAVASHACAHIGAVQVPIFSGFAAPSIASRLEDSQAKVVLCADWSLRRGKRIEMRDTLEEAGRFAVEHIVAWNRETGEWPEVVTKQPGTLAPRRGRLGGSVPAGLHLGDDGQAEGRAARPGRLPRLDRAGDRLPDRREGGRPHPLLDGHGLDHGAVDGARRRRRRRDDRLRGGRSRLARRPAVAPRRVRARDDARPLAHARARTDPERASRPPTSHRCARSVRRASRGTPTRTAGSSSTPAAGARRSSTSRAAPRSAPAS